MNIDDKIYIPRIREYGFIDEITDGTVRIGKEGYNITDIKVCDEESNRDFYDFRFSSDIGEFCIEKLGFLPSTKYLISLSTHVNKNYNQDIITLRYKDKKKTGNGYYSVTYKKGENGEYKETN